MIKVIYLGRETNLVVTINGEELSRKIVLLVLFILMKEVDFYAVSPRFII